MQFSVIVLSFQYKYLSKITFIFLFRGFKGTAMFSTAKYILLQMFIRMMRFLQNFPFFKLLSPAESAENRRKEKLNFGFHR
jgi:hypothetical protein